VVKEGVAPRFLIPRMRLEKRYLGLLKREIGILRRDLGKDFGIRYTYKLMNVVIGIGFWEGGFLCVALFSGLVLS
jgi:hypothetical protein